MRNAVISAAGLSKRYQLGPAVRGPRAWLRRLRGGADARDVLWALRDVSFDIAPGEVVGIIGRNGAGKSTLLKILARIVAPTTGQAVLRGKVGSLLEVGTGFHPDLSGRENIYLSGAILGMSRTDIRSSFDAIVDFAELSQFLDTPVKRYSSGMYVRLAFAVAAHLNPEILLVDEVLAVGDVQFQKKCLGKMSDVARSGRTILFVSHNMAAVEGLCQRGLVIDGGQLAFDGPVGSALQHYLATSPADPDGDLAARTDREGDGRLRFTAVRFGTPTGRTDTLLTGQTLRVEIDYVGDGELRNVALSVPFFTRLGQSLFMGWTRLVGADFAQLPPRGTLVLEVPRLPLRAGAYAINLYCEVNGALADWVRDAAHFDVLDGDFFGAGRMPPPGHGVFVVPHRFWLRDAAAEAPESAVVAAGAE